jgi:hypothetical protein
MPVELEKKIRARVNKDYPNLSQEKKNAIIYSILRKTGWKPKREEASMTLMDMDKEMKSIAEAIMKDLYKEVK